MEPRPEAGETDEDDGDLAVFGSWPRAYAAVIASAVVVMVLVAVFSYWSY